MFSPLGSPLRLSPEAEQTRREEILLEIAHKAARAGGLNPDTLAQADLDRLLTHAREQFAWASLAELEAAALMMK